MAEYIVEQALDFLHEFLRRIIYRTVLKRTAPEPKAKHKAVEKPAPRRRRRGAPAGQMLVNIALIVVAALVLRRFLQRRLSA